MIESRENDLILKGKSLFDEGSYSQARNCLSEAIEINPRNTEAYFMLGNIFHLKGEIGKAIKAFNKLLEIDHAHTDAAISLSILYNDIGRYEEAKKIFNSAQERVKKNRNNVLVQDDHINKKFAHKHHEIADLYLTYNRFDEALYEFNKAIGLDPDNLDLQIKLAKVYAKKGFVNKAFEVLRKLKNENPGYMPARVALGILQYGNGSIIEAQSEWQNVLAKDPENKEAKMYLKISEAATETRIQ